ncbi:hypothetical protein VC83_07895 [Pseudogymnoascus destructans]|uniref:LPXTG-domain-containing protein n=2 Tax=Pseudogymnoascus destructans TaxID=655981 RepID=L8FRX6_PSED2|nr:uncharacterized protein VC83_07895 [Pseudogymnoascus destructans]ELR02471.1 hypothetical protein GMDG_05520 [Pseudogymnoascus destructans 20631-21]OAF55797.1 hypothetical protein VC83_07895 [Pseudogymnoascus destructans]
MRLFIPSTAIVAAGFVGQSAAIRTVPSSPCASLCGDVTSTTNSEILCTQADLNTTKGQVFSKCISCQMTSTAMDPKTGDTDLKWVLYNLRYAMSSCMWGFPGNSSVQNTPCLTSRACEPFQGNLQYQGLSPNITTYDYCPNTLPSEVIINRCKDCIRQGDQTYLSNYFITILAGCAIQNGAPLPLHKDLFSGDYVNPLDFRSHADSEATSNSPTMSLGTRIGIAIAGICVLLALIGITIVCCGKRRRRTRIAERQRGAEGYTGFGSTNRVLPAPRVTTKWESNMSGVQEESPMSANAYLNDKNGFSPYSSQYNSPVSARDAVAPQQWEWPQQQGYEMKKVASVVTPVDKEQEDQRLHKEWAMEAATRGFTVSSSMGMPPPPPRARQ